MKLENKRVAFLGDSITEGAGASSAEKKYVRRVKELAGLKDALNYGISGTRIALKKTPSAVAKFDQDFISRVPAMEADVDAVVVFGGTNDFGHGDAPLGEFGDTENTTFYGACHMLMKLLIEKYPSIPIVFITPLHRLNEDTLINGIGLERKPLCDFVSAIRETAERFSIPVLDLYAASGMSVEPECQNKLYFFDGLHPNDLGHERIARLLIHFFEKEIL